MMTRNPRNVRIGKITHAWLALSGMTLCRVAFVLATKRTSDDPRPPGNKTTREVDCMACLAWSGT